MPRAFVPRGGYRVVRIAPLEEPEPMQPPIPGTPARSTPLARLRGIWRSHGYGILLEIGPERYRLHEETAVSCLRVFEGSLEELAGFYVDVRRSPGGRAFSARRATGVTRVRFRRLKALPPRCAAEGRLLDDDPVRSFEVLWHTFRERYALFDLRGVDWDAVWARHRPTVSARTGERRLFETFVAMLRPLRDGHTELRAPQGRFNAGGPSPAQERLAAELGLPAHDPDVALELEALRERARANIAERYLAAGTRRAAGGLLQWGRLSADIGYLAIRAMAGQSGRAHRPREDQAAAAAAMDRVVKDLGHLPTLVVDVRDNGGGYDGVSLRIAGRLIDRKRLAFTKAASKGEGYGGQQAVYVEPRGRHRFTGRIALLTSGLTVSAAEIFVLSLLHHPRLVRIGEPTCGELSDVMERHLPNGWAVNLSNELYRAADGKLYEDRGIPPHVEIPFLHPKDVEAGRDPALDHVLEKGTALWP